MVDNRSAGILGVGGGINFKSGDISGTAAKTADDRASQGTEYFMQDDEEQQNAKGEAFVDRSMQLRASLNSLALMNVVSVMQNQNKMKTVLFDDDDDVNDKDKTKSSKIKKVSKKSKKSKKEK